MASSINGSHGGVGNIFPKQDVFAKSHWAGSAPGLFVGRDCVMIDREDQGASFKPLGGIILFLGRDVPIGCSASAPG